MGTQKIKLGYFLSKSRVSLKNFCERNDLKSYDDLVNYCLSKNFIAVTEEEYKKSFPPVVKKEKKKVVEVSKVAQPSEEKKTRKRRSSKKSSDSENGDIDPSV